MGTRVNGGIQAFGDPPRPYREPVTYSHEGTFMVLACDVKSLAKSGGSFDLH